MKAISSILVLPRIMSYLAKCSAIAEMVRSSTIEFIYSSSTQLPMQLNKLLTPILSLTLTLAALSSPVKIVTSQELGSPVAPTSQIQTASNIFPIKLNGKWGYIDRTGKIVVQPQFDHAFAYRDDLAPVQVGCKLGFINRIGKIVITPQFDFAFDFRDMTISNHEVLAPESIGDESCVKGNGTGLFSFASYVKDAITVVTGDKWAYIDRTGKTISKPQFIKTDTSFEELVPVKVDRKYGYKDRNGKIVIQPKFDLTFGFKEGLAQVMVGNRRNGYKLGYIDRTGKYAIPLGKFDNLGGYFSQGLAKVQIAYKGGYMDRTGTVVIKPQFDEVFDFYDGLAKVIIDRKIGYIDRTGKYIWQPSE